MSHRRRLTPNAPLAHDYELEPPDDIIAELQSTVVQSRQRGDRSRSELLEDLAKAARELVQHAEPRVAMDVAALAILLRMEVAA
jgi:hypothetical protein